MEMPAADPDAADAGLRRRQHAAARARPTTRSTASCRSARRTQASVLFLRSLGGAYGDVPQDGTAFPARDATWFAMAGAFDIPGLSTTRAGRAIQADVGRDRGARVGRLRQLHASTDPAFARRMYPPADDGAPRRGQARVGPARTSSAATTTCCRPDEPVVRRRRARRDRRRRQCVSSASISVRSPDHSVWKVPGLSMRL